MMDRTLLPHLTEKELLALIVDGKGLSEKALIHVQACPDCSGRVNALETGLSRIGDLAREYSPEPLKTPRIPKENPRPFRWRPVLASVFTLALVVWGSYKFFPPELPPKPESKVRITEKLWEDDRFMDEVSSLSENALPEEFMDVLSKSDLEGQPSDENKPESGKRSSSVGPLRKGVRKC